MLPKWLKEGYRSAVANERSLDLWAFTFVFGLMIGAICSVIVSEYFIPGQDKKTIILVLSGVLSMLGVFLGRVAWEYTDYCYKAVAWMMSLENVDCEEYKVLRRTLQNCLDSARCIGDSGLQAKLREANRQLRFVALEFKRLHETFQSTSSVSWRAELEMNMSAIRMKLQQVNLYYENQTRIMEESLVSIDNVVSQSPNLTETDRLVRLVEDDHEERTSGNLPLISRKIKNCK